MSALSIDDWSDPRWRLNSLYWIIDKAGHRVPFRMNWAQESLFDDLHYQNLVLKARQLGFTTFIQLIMLDACMFTSDIRAGTIAHTREDAEAFFRDKVKYPYDNLPVLLRENNPATEDSARKLTFANNSSLRVGTSLRSGTFQYLHISEYGKICAKYPEKAKEIRTGALNTVQSGQMIFIESTAEGTEGDFYDKCQAAQTAGRLGHKLTPLDFKFFFFPWWKHPEYELDPLDVVHPPEMARYFEALEQKGVTLSEPQKAWYTKKALQQSADLRSHDDMKREYPSTPEEAFEASIEGAYYGAQIARAEEDGRVTKVPHDEALRVETWWDLGLDDSMSIWFVQRNGTALQFIDYYENSGEGLAHYAGVLDEKQRKHAYRYDDPLWPHDGNSRVLDEHGRRKNEIMAGLGYKPRIQERGNLMDGIEAVRAILSRCWFDEGRCAEGLKALKAYRKEWNEDRGCWGSKPYHNWASHGADALRTGAKAKPPRARDTGPLDLGREHVSNNII